MSKSKNDVKLAVKPIYMNSSRKILFAIYLVIPAVFLLYLLLQNIPVSGQLIQTLKFSNYNAGLVSYLYPGNRLSEIKKIGNDYFLPMKSTIAYFDLRKPALAFEHINLSLSYAVSEDTPEVRLGIPAGKDQFQEILLYQKYLDQLDWPETVSDNDLHLWRKNGIEPIDISDFLQNPPVDGKIAVHQTAPMPQLKMANYKPTKQTIDWPYTLQGRHTFITYLENEPLTLSFEKKNISPGTKESLKMFDFLNREIYSADISQPDKYQFKTDNLPAGRYKIDFNLAENSQLAEIQTTGTYLTIKDRILIADYPDTSKPAETKISFSGPRLVARPLSPADYQTLKIDQQNITVQADSLDLSLELPPNSFDQSLTLTLSRPNLLLESPGGYFALDNFTKIFNPAPANAIGLTYQTDPEEFAQADYILARYLPPEKDGDLRTNDYSTGLASLYFDTETHSWPFAIYAPGIEKNCSTLDLKEIRAAFQRPPLSWNEIKRLVGKIIKK